jgi:hypothetical protein
MYIGLNDERRLPLRYCKRQTPSTLGLLTTHNKIKWRWPPLLSKYSCYFDSGFTNVYYICPPNLPSTCVALIFLQQRMTMN